MFDRRCVAHHGANGDAGLDLRSAQSYNNLVNAQSTQTAMVLVSPGDPDASYLIHKLEGGGTIVGARMPIMGSFLTADETATIRRWIEEGAPNN